MIVQSHFDSNDVTCDHSVGSTIKAILVKQFSQYDVHMTCCDLNLVMVSNVQLHFSVYSNTGIGLINYKSTSNLKMSDDNFNNSIVLSISNCSFTDSVVELDLVNYNMTDISFFNGTIRDCFNVKFSFLIIGEGLFFLEIKGCKNSELAGGVQGRIENFNQSASSLFELSIDSCSFYLPQMFSFTALGSRNRSIQITNSTIHNSLFSVLNFSYNILFYQTYFIESTITLNLSPVLVNKVSFNATDVTISEGYLSLVGPFTALIDGCVFQNSGYDFSFSPFVVSRVNLFFSGETVFANNVGIQGSAINLFDSKLYMNNHSRLFFVNNTAKDKGGAIYIDNPTPSLGRGIFEQECPLMLSYSVDNVSDSRVYFQGNRAQNGGSNIYGTSLKSDCQISPDGTLSYKLQSDIFKMDSNSEFQLSSVSSNPKRVCLCDHGIPMCSNYSYIVQDKKYSPGEKFNLSLVLVGDDFGTTTGSVYALLFTNGHSIPFDHEQSIKSLSTTSCVSVEYVMYSKEENGTVLLLLAADIVDILNSESREFSFDYLISSICNYHNKNELEDDLATTPILLNINLQYCPLGLFLDRNNSSCQCIEWLQYYGITTCATVDGEGFVYRDGTVWVSNSDNETGVVAYKYCPFNYCETEEIAVNLLNPDSQCTFNHSGILCGGCSPNLSLALGSPQCLSCSDNGHVAFFVPFAIAGIVLVLFIKLFDLTITKGAVNGLLLYANILWTNQSIFFPHAIRRSSSLFHFFTTFVAWLNLDLGIETCFIQGLDMYWKTWLQFLFPLYIWSIAGLIILACRYSDKATKLFGNNSVHVLATLFLLSYSKLLRTIITSLEFAILDYPSGTRVVWLADGNVPYFGVRHSFLLIAAIFALIIFWLPYTVTILLVPWLRKCGNISWINKLKPFFDAHYGPLKDKHQYWIGLTLLVRVILAITNVAIQAIDPTINILVTIALSSLLLYVVGFSYKKWYLSILEASFVANVIILGGGFLYSSNQHFQNAFASVSVGIAFLTFLLIICVQGYTQLKTLCRCKTCVRREYENINGVNDSKTESVPPTHSVVSLYDNTTQDYYPLRESLLESVIAGE